MINHFGATLPQAKATWEDVVVAARELEALGYDSLWTDDHLQLPYNGNAETPLFEPWSLLAAIAPLTKRAQIGTNVTNTMFRHPAVLAKQIVTVDHVSRGRVVAGFGAGYYTKEFIQNGCPPWNMSARVEALTEMVPLIRSIMRSEVVTFEGTYFKMRGARAFPSPLNDVPVMVCGASERILALAAAHADVWNHPPTFRPTLAGTVRRLRKACATLGRDPDTLTISARVRAILGQTESDLRKSERLARERLGDGPVDEIVEHGLYGTPEQMCDRLAAHANTGCSALIIDFYGAPRLESAAMMAESASLLGTFRAALRGGPVRTKPTMG